MNVSGLSLAAFLTTVTLNTLINTMTEGTALDPFTDSDLDVPSLLDSDNQLE